MDHEWKQHQALGYTVCIKCGIVQRADGQNHSTCPGPVHVMTREPADDVQAYRIKPLKWGGLSGRSGDGSAYFVGCNPVGKWYWFPGADYARKTPENFVGTLEEAKQACERHHREHLLLSLAPVEVGSPDTRLALLKGVAFAVVNAFGIGDRDAESAAVRKLRDCMDLPDDAPIGQVQAWLDGAGIDTKPALDRVKLALAERRGNPCTCHPSDNPPKPCPKKYALSDCRSAAGGDPFPPRSEVNEAQRELDALGDVPDLTPSEVETHVEAVLGLISSSRAGRPECGDSRMSPDYCLQCSGHESLCTRIDAEECKCPCHSWKSNVPKEVMELHCDKCIPREPESQC